MVKPFRIWFVLAIAWSLAVAGPARAVVIASGDGTGNTTVPSNDPGFANVGELNSASAVYIGDRWVLTAAHVGPGNVTLNGTTYQIDPNTAVQLQNPAGFSLTQGTDLAMFQITQDPGLPSLTIDTSSLGAGTSVMMIGNGKGRAPTQTFWDRTGAADTATVTWTPTNPGLANAAGYVADGPQATRWGFNVISNPTTSILTSNNLNLLALTTEFFSSAPFPHEAQAATGDSGGGLFSLVNGKWELSGIIDSISTLPGQPADTAVFGDLTYSADLSIYNSQIVKIMHDATVPWQNPNNPLDVTNDGSVTAQDALTLINGLNFGITTLPTSYDGSSPYFDVNGDNLLSAADVIEVINALNATSSSSFVSSIDVPEPSTWALAAVGFAILLLASCRRRFARPARV